MDTPIHTATLSGLAPKILRIESTMVSGFAKLQVVGNVGDISRDGSERVRAALEKIDHPIPNHRVVVSVSPSDVPKEGNHYDLPIAVSLLGLLAPRSWVIDPGEWLFAGELALDGKVRGIRGGVAFATLALQRKFTGIVVPASNLPELQMLSRLNPDRFRHLSILGFSHLKDVESWLISGEDPAPAAAQTPLRVVEDEMKVHDFDDMFVTPSMERLALTIAVGRHSCLLRGSPGCGKTMFAERIPSILPTMEADEHLEALTVQTTASTKVPPGILGGRPPFRAPHHQASTPSLLGTTERPGELSLAHGGVLFLDELPEFRRDLIEALREPLETGWVQVSRAKLATSWCAKVILLAAANNCPCGWFGSGRRKCGCGMAKVIAYRDKLSGPIQDRIDLHVDIPEPRQSTADLFSIDSSGGRTRRMCQQVLDVVAKTKTRNARYGAIFNRDLPTQYLLACCDLSGDQLEAYLEELTESRALGHRAVIRLLRVARTLADLDGEEAVRYPHVREAWGWHAAGAAQARGDQFCGL